MSDDFKEKLFVLQSAIMEAGIDFINKNSSLLTTEMAESIQDYFEANEYGLAMDVLRESLWGGPDLQGISKNDFEKIELLMDHVEELYKSGR